MLKDVLKRFFRSIGLYRLARATYRAVHPKIVQDRRSDLSLYGQFLSENDLVFDIGANLGQKSEIFLKLGARVVALEPNPGCVRHLRESVGKSDRCRIVEKAVGAQEGEAQLSFRGTSAAGSLRSDWHALKYGDGDLETRIVEVTTLDRLIAEHGTPVFCKIDVEGFEKEVMSGLSTLPPMLSFEYHASEMDKALECLDILARLGPVELNIYPVHRQTLIFDEWLDPESFRKRLEDTSPPKVGDIFVRSVKAGVVR